MIILISVIGETLSESFGYSKIVIDIPQPSHLVLKI